MWFDGTIQDGRGSLFSGVSGNNADSIFVLTGFHRDVEEILSVLCYFIYFTVMLPSSGSTKI